MFHGESHPEDELLHRLKNHLTVVIGFAELLLQDLPAADTKRKDVAEIHLAASNALAEIPELARRLARGTNDE